jgi:superfamily II DNA or RNA helicase
MDLSGLHFLRPSYRTGRDDIVADFYVPCLNSCFLYRRAVGYFTSRGLALAARGIAALLDNCGKMQLVASPALEAADVQALIEGDEKREDVLRRVAERSLKDIESFISKETLSALAWLVAKGALEVRLALRKSVDGRPGVGIYHEKLGIFSDTEGNHVAFSGSANETSGGLADNFESIDVFCSWNDPQDRVAMKIADFDELWENTAAGVEVFEFTNFSRELLQRYQLPKPAPANNNVAPAPEPRKARNKLEIQKPPRDYQAEAIANWLAAGCKGILAMATGSGKTLTALHAVNKLAERGPLVVIIACPYTNLAEQWVRELQEAGISNPVKAYGSKSKWHAQLQANLSAMQLGGLDFLPIVVVNRTFLGSEFQSLLCPEKVPHLLVADEMHNLGAENLRTRLNPTFPYRLGLSATPERHMDYEGTKALFDYFGDVVYTYDLQRAIKEGNLCQYYYHPILVQLTDDEAIKYQNISSDIARLMAGQSSDEPLPAALQMKLLERARLLASAEGKIPALLATIADLRAQARPISSALVYCGDGRVDETDDDHQLVRQIDAAVRQLGIDADLRVRRFTHNETSRSREQLLGELRTRRLDALVAIRCLDEGIDLPDIRMGFILASSTNPRQFVQRRGRLLRKADGKEYAEIWDFIVSPPDLTDLTDDQTFNLERRLVKKELLRVIEFCRTARNAAAAENVLLDLKRRYNLLGSF